MQKNMVEPHRIQMKDKENAEKMCYTCQITKVRMQTHDDIFDFYCSSTARMVMQPCFSIMLYVRCL